MFEFEKKIQNGFEENDKKGFSFYCRSNSLQFVVQLEKKSLNSLIITFVGIVYYCVLKYQSFLHVLTTFFIKTIAH